MASSPIEIPIASETKAFKQGIEIGVIAPLEDAEDALDALGKSQGPEQLERDLMEASKASDNLKRDTEQTAQAIEQEYRDAYRKMKVSADDAYDKVRQGGNEFKQEAIQNVSQVASSFDGSFQGIADGIQGTLGGAVVGLSTLGGAGLAAAGGLALAGGAVGSIFNQIGADSEAAAQRVSDAFDDMIESGNAFISEGLIDKNLQAIFGDDAKLAQAKEDAKELGVATTDVLRAMAGDQEKINSLIDEANANRQKEIDLLKESNSTDQFIADRTDAINTLYDARLEKFQDLNGEAQKTVDKVNLYLQTTDKQAAADQRNAQILADKIKSVPQTVPVRVELDSTAIDKYIAGLKARHIPIVADVIDRYGRTIR